MVDHCTVKLLRTAPALTNLEIKHTFRPVRQCLDSGRRQSFTLLTFVQFVMEGLDSIIRKGCFFRLRM